MRDLITSPEVKELERPVRSSRRKFMIVPGDRNANEPRELLLAFEKTRQPVVRQCCAKGGDPLTSFALSGDPN